MNGETRPVEPPYDETAESLLDIVADITRDMPAATPAPPAPAGCVPGPAELDQRQSVLRPLHAREGHVAAGSREAHAEPNHGVAHLEEVGPRATLALVPERVWGPARVNLSAGNEEAWAIVAPEGGELGVRCRFDGHADSWWYPGPQDERDVWRAAFLHERARAEAAERERDLLVSQTPIEAVVAALDASILRRKLQRAEAKAAEAFAEVTAGLEREKGLQARLAIVHASHEDVWFWQGDSGDHPESLSCPVVMSADTLRAFVDQAERADANDERAVMYERRCHAAVENLRTWQRQAGPGHPLAGAFKDALRGLGVEP